MNPNGTLLIIENNGRLSKNDQVYVFEFLKTWEGDTIDFSGFSQKTQNQIVEAVFKCTDIITQTCFVNGSDYQFDDMAHLLSKVPDSKNIYISYLGGDLYEYMDRALTDEQLVDIRHHKVYEWKNKRDGLGMRADLMDFSKRVNAKLKKIESKRQYNITAKDRPTGRKIKILFCNGSGKPFEGLPIGEVVDELDMSKADPNKNRGVWVWGNGEPIKLINDCGIDEYEIATELTFEMFMDEVRKSIGLDLRKLNGLELEGILSLLEDEEYNPMDIANFVCEVTKIEKRGNRAKLKALIQQLRKTETV